MSAPSPEPVRVEGQGTPGMSVYSTLRTGLLEIKGKVSDVEFARAAGWLDLHERLEA